MKKQITLNTILYVGCASLIIAGVLTAAVIVIAKNWDYIVYTMHH